MDVQDGFGAFGWEGGEGGDTDGDVVADTGAFEDGLIGGLREEASAEVGDHASVIVACEALRWTGMDCAVKILKRRLDNYSNVMDS
jgi:hypothetical protein